MTDPRLDFLDRLEAATRERMQRVDRLAGAVAAITGEATSPDRLVTVKVAPSGALTHLELDDDALDLDARELAALVLATARTATERAAAAMKEAVTPLEEPLVVPDAAPSGLGGSAAQDPASRLDATLDRAERTADDVEDRLRAQERG